MARCRKISRLITLVGLCAFAGAITWGAGVAEAAPTCSRVLMRELTSTEISQVFTSIAQMKLNLDLLRSEGSNPLQAKVLSEQFEIKLAELIHSLGDKHSAEAIKNLLKIEISKLQERTSVEKLKDSEARAQERSISPFIDLVYDRTIELTDPASSKLMEYLPEINAVFFMDRSRKSLIRKNLKDETEVTVFIGEEMQPFLLPDGKTFIILESNGRLTKLNGVDGKIEPLNSVLEIKLNAMLDPSGEVLVLSNYQSMIIYDITKQTSKEINVTSSLAPISVAKNKLLLLGLKETPSIYNIDTNTHIKINTDFKYPDATILSEDGSLIGLHKGNSDIQIFDINNPTVQISSAALPSDTFKIRKNSRNSLIHISSGGVLDTAKYGVYSLKDLENPLFQFEGIRPDNEILGNIELSSDSKSAAIGYLNFKMELDKIVIWKAR